MAGVKINIGADTSGFTSGMNKASSSLDRFLERENKVKGQLGGLVSDLGNAQTGAEALTSVIDRLAETFRIGLAASIGVAVGVKAQKEIDKLSESLDAISQIEYTGNLQQLEGELVKVNNLATDISKGLPSLIDVLSGGAASSAIESSRNRLEKEIEDRQKRAGAERINLAEKELNILKMRNDGRSLEANLLKQSIDYQKQIEDISKSGLLPAEQERLLILAKQTDEIKRQQIIRQAEEEREKKRAQWAEEDRQNSIKQEKERMEAATERADKSVEKAKKQTDESTRIADEAERFRDLDMEREILNFKGTDKEKNKFRLEKEIENMKQKRDSIQGSGLKENNDRLELENKITEKQLQLENLGKSKTNASVVSSSLAAIGGGGGAYSGTMGAAQDTAKNTGKMADLLGQLVQLWKDDGSLAAPSALGGAPLTLT